MDSANEKDLSFLLKQNAILNAKNVSNFFRNAIGTKKLYLKNLNNDTKFY